MILDNKIIWITGASSGIGKALAIELSKKNSKIIISSRNEAALLAVKNECKTPENIQILALDLEDYGGFSETVKKAISLFGKIDILINNGGISQRAKAIDTTIETDKRIMDINYMGTMSLSKALLPHFISNKSGHYVTITSITGQVATPLRSSYAASKHALHGFFDSLRSEVYDYNIAVTLVLPGYVRTQLSFNALVGDGSKQDKMDTATDTGILPEIFAEKLIKAIEKRKREVVIAGLRETAAIYIKRFFPGFLANKVRKVNVV
jgi:dehydrogenase/reductase SDR family protein 7B